MRRLLGAGAVFVAAAACATPSTEVAATDTSAAKAEAQRQVSEAEAFAADAQRQIDQAEAALAEAERVIAEKQAQAAREKAAAARAARAARSATTVRPRAAAVPTGDVWGRLAQCESGGNPRAVGGGGRYFGAFQFSLGTWRSVGGTGNPIDHDYATQLTFAQKLQARSGWGQWPYCARKLGLI